jgi:5'-phosphate synthase pdxT subunit
VGEVDAPDLGGPLPAVFIRAPRIRRVGPGVEVLATRESEPVLVAQANVIAATFHPELTSATTVHELAFGPRRFEQRTA